MNPAIVKRIEKQGLGKEMSWQSKGMPCIICGNNFSNCPCSVGDTQSVLQLYRSMKLAGML